MPVLLPQLLLLLLLITIKLIITIMITITIIVIVIIISLLLVLINSSYKISTCYMINRTYYCHYDTTHINGIT